MEVNDNLLSSEEYIGIGLDITDKISGETIFTTQVQFGNRIFEILGHGLSIDGLKSVWSGVFDCNLVEVHYFSMIERTYKIETPEGFQRVIKYEILEILD